MQANNPNAVQIYEELRSAIQHVGLHAKAEAFDITLELREERFEYEYAIQAATKIFDVVNELTSDYWIKPKGKVAIETKIEALELKKQTHTTSVDTQLSVLKPSHVPPDGLPQKPDETYLFENILILNSF